MSPYGHQLSRLALYQAKRPRQPTNIDINPNLKDSLYHTTYYAPNRKIPRLKMNVSWNDRLQKTLEQLENLKSQRDLDRLDLVKNMRFSFGALSQSLSGWMQWVNSPEVMSQFTQEEMLEMSDQLIEMVTGFVKYDQEITDFGLQKGLGKQKEEEDANKFVI